MEELRRVNGRKSSDWSYIMLFIGDEKLHLCISSNPRATKINQRDHFSLSHWMKTIAPGNLIFPANDILDFLLS